MEATQSLERDHRIIEKVLPALARLGEKAEELQLKQSEEVAAVLQFLRTFVDAYHHGKEELYLFKVMEERGVPRDRGLVLHLLKEHGEGRSHVRAMSETVALAQRGSPEAAANFAQHAHQYVDLLRDHIAEEDTKLWPLAESVLTQEDDTRITHGYAQVERETIGDGGLAHFSQQAQAMVQVENEV